MGRVMWICKRKRLYGSAIGRGRSAYFFRRQGPTFFLCVVFFHSSCFFLVPWEGGKKKTNLTNQALQYDQFLYDHLHSFLQDVFLRFS